MPRQTVVAEFEWAAWLAAVLLALSIVLGGGGSPAPLLEVALQCCATLAAAAWLFANRDGLGRVPARAWWLAGLIALLPALQLIPLPPALWQGLPGRADQRAALDLVAAGDSWRALTLSPPRTVASLLAALAAGLSLVMAASLGERGRMRLITVVGALGLATLVVGAAQLSGGSGNPARFFDPEEIFLTGFQANHNSTADVILIAMIALAAVLRNWLRRGAITLTSLQLAGVAVVADGVLVLGLFLAGSRAGLALLPLALLFQFLILQPGTRLPWGKLGLSAATAAGLGGGALFLLRDNRAIAAVLNRFTLSGEFRPELWKDSLHALGQYWPAGSGQGTFVPVMLAAERLEVVDPTLPNRAHNDYLELAIGGGLPGAIVLAAIAALLLSALWRALRASHKVPREQVLFAAGTLAIVALHSLVDYPLRSMALAAIAATAAGLLIPARQPEPEQLEGSRP